MNHIYLKQIIEKAIKDGKYVNIDYVSKKMEITSRIVEPYEIKDDKKKGMILIGHCYLRNDLREFQFDGIQAIEVTDPTDYGKSKEVSEPSS